MATISISFKFAASKSDKQFGTIYARVAMGGERKDVATPLKTYKENFEKGEFIGENSKELNNQLITIRSELLNIYNYLRFNYLELSASTVTKVYNQKLVVMDNKLINPEKISEYKRLQEQEAAQEQVEKKKTFLQMYSKYLKSQEIKEQWSEGTIRTQISRFNNIAKFLRKEKKINVTPDKFRTKLLDDFVIWGMSSDSNKKVWSKDYVARHVEMIRNVIRYSIIQEEIESSPLVLIESDRENRTDKTHLTSDELQRFEKATFNDELLDKVKDIFLFMCYTAMNISDYLNFAQDLHSYIHKQKDMEFIIQNRQKLRKRFNNKIMALIPITQNVQGLLDKYKYHLPVYADQTINKVLKKIGRRLNIDNKKMTTKVARKTFAQESYNSDIDIRAVSGMMGHASTKTTERSYANVKIDFIADQIKKNTKN